LFLSVCDSAFVVSFASLFLCDGGWLAKPNNMNQQHTHVNQADGWGGLWQAVVHQASHVTKLCCSALPLKPFLDFGPCGFGNSKRR
jgi:hypothetical protein